MDFGIEAKPYDSATAAKYNLEPGVEEWVPWNPIQQFGEKWRWQQSRLHNDQVVQAQSKELIGDIQQTLDQALAANPNLTIPEAKEAIGMHLGAKWKLLSLSLEAKTNNWQ